jgi:hypothetical protein
MIIYTLKNQKKKINNLFKKYLIIALTTFIFVSFPNENIAAQKGGVTSLTSKTKAVKKKRTTYRRSKRRSYNPSKTRAEAIELIRRSSEEVCQLAGLEPIIGDSMFVYDDSDDAEEIEEFVDDIEYCEFQEEVAGMNEDSSESEDEIENAPVDMQTFRMLWLSYVDDGESEEYTQGGIHKKTIMNVIMDWLGTPYRFGGTTRRAIDCSAFIQRVFTEVCDLTLPRTARVQVKIGAEISREELEFGDLIFFHTYTYRYASHVGIYLADGLFAHASSKYGVTVSSLNSRYYSSHFIGARRLFLNDLERYVNKTSYSLTE